MTGDRRQTPRPPVAGDADVPQVSEFVEVRLVDRKGVDHNPNPGFVLDDTLTLVEQLRSEGRTVLVHCVHAHSRTPTIVALYGMRLNGVSAQRSLGDLQRVLPDACPIRDFRLANISRWWRIRPLIIRFRREDVRWRS